MKKFNRRESMLLTGSAATTLVFGGCAQTPTRAVSVGAASSCLVTPQAFDGPFFVTGSPDLVDITQGKAGLPVTLRLNILNAGTPGCVQMVEGAEVHVWQADADGIYSHVPGNYAAQDTRGETFLRGMQHTDESGSVEFKTIFPGWYLQEGSGPRKTFLRTEHIHVKVYAQNKVSTFQIYYPNTFANEAYLSVPGYMDNPQRYSRVDDRFYDRPQNEEDWIFTQQGGPVLSLTPIANGYLAEADIIIAQMPNTRINLGAWPE